MKSLFEDEFMNKYLLARLTREIRREQLYKTIDELNYLNEAQNRIISQYNIDVSKNPKK